MTYVQIILSAAKAAKVSGALLLAICTQESNLTNVVVYHDGDSPSFGVCQIKFETAKMVGYKGKAGKLIDPTVSIPLAAKYLKYQLNRYNDNVCKAVSAYNAGSYIEGKKTPGRAFNHRYNKSVRNKLPENLKSGLDCEVK